MEYLQGRCQQLVNAGIARNTALTYRTALNSFNSFRTLYKLPNAWPIPLRDVTHFIAYCFEKTMSAKTISTYISGLAFVHKLNSWYDITQCFIVKKLLEGCHRSRPSFDKRAPITCNMLKEICSLLPSVCFNQYENSLFTAMFCLAFFGLFRVGELATNRCKSNVLNLADVTFENANKTLHITMHHYKSKQRGRPVILKIPCEDDELTCPVCTLMNYLKLRVSRAGALFIHMNGSPVTRYQFAAVLKKCIDRSKFNSSHFRTHSFRIGRATHLSSLGIPGSAIMKLGRWRSSAHTLYIR